MGRGEAPGEDGEDTMTVKAACERLNLCEKSVRVLLASGRLGCRRLGPRAGKIDITDDHINAYFAACEAAPASARAGSVRRPARRKLALKHLPEPA